MRKMWIAVAAVLALGTLAACDEGPAEEAGERIDRAVDDAADAVKQD